MKPSNNLENMISSEIYWRVQLVYVKVQAHSSLEPPLEYNQNQKDTFDKVHYDLFNHLGGYRNIIVSDEF